MPEGERRLSAIMFTDMVGYTALGQRNESLSIALVEEQRKLIRPLLNKHNGREVKTIGDAFLVEFPNAVDAVRCAYDIQRTIREFNLSLESDKRIHLRIGIHVGEVIESHDDIYGDAVNVASRIQPLAEDGGVCLTRQVHDHVANKVDLQMISLGQKDLKNVVTQIEVYKLVMPWGEVAPLIGGQALPRDRIAVLPFRNMSPDPNDEYFAEGITEEIISTVSGISGLSVISRTSVMGYRGTTKKIEEIGKELRVGSVLEGSFRKAGNRIRVTAQLIDAVDDRHLWAQNYDRDLDDVFVVQSDIAKQVTEALRIKILSSEEERISRKPTENTLAYELYLRGRQMWNKRGKDDLLKAAEYFEQSLKEDPDFALGYAALASCHQLLSGQLMIDWEENHQKAKTLVTRALELDNNLAEAHATRGIVMGDETNLKAMEEEMKKAIELKPSYASAHQWYYLLLLSLVRMDEARLQIAKAVELDPLSQVIAYNHAGYFLSQRNYPEAIRRLKDTIELDPSSFLTSTSRLGLMYAYGKMKMLGEATREAGLAIMRLRDSYPNVEAMVAVWMAYFKDDNEELRKSLRELENKPEEGWTGVSLNYTIAGFCIHLGEVSKGFDLLGKALRKKEPDVFYIKTEELFDSVRTDPRYLDLLKRLGLD